MACIAGLLIDGLRAGRCIRVGRLLFVAAAALAGSSATSLAQTLDRIAETNMVRIGFVADQAPFAFKGADGTPAGYAIDLCTAVVRALGKRVPGVTPRYVETTLPDAVGAVAAGRIDLLCGAVTATLGRRETVDFSEPIFLTGMSALMHVHSLRNLRELFFGGREISPPRSPEMRPFATMHIGVRMGTTTETVLRRAIESGGYEVAIVGYPAHADGLEALESGEIDAYFADRGLLIGLLAQARDPSSLVLGARVFSREPYAIAMQRGDADMRLLVDRALTEFYETPQFAGLLRRYFHNEAPAIEAQILSLSLPQ
jgi:polar amino acid transport system substrate-binding protein